ncbi:MAG: hypothetical protein IKE46_11920 [Selenomonadaceae bacterium]|nr:hypothetical protein [Selenomonadaceae bacterium]
MRRKELQALIDKYIAEHFTGDEILDYDLMEDNFSSSIKFENCFPEPQFLLPRSEEIFDFDKIFEQTESETFSEMLMRLVKESGKKPSEIYKRADLDRQIFSRIKLNKDYQPSKDTAIAFAFALKLDLPTTKKLLETAGFALSSASKRDVIISFFIDSEIFSLRKLNENLYDYGQAVLLNRE